MKSGELMKKTIAIAMSPISLVGAAEAQQTSGSRPNVLVIAVEELIGCLDAMNGETTVHTSKINALVRGGRVK